MTIVDPLYAQWLQTDALWSTRTDAAMLARWGDRAATGERVTGIATLAGADAEADRQLAFLARGPFAIDVHPVVGTDWLSDLGRVVTIVGEDLGYDAGVDVFVLEVQVDRAQGISTLAVLRPLAAV